MDVVDIARIVSSGGACAGFEYPIRSSFAGPDLTNLSKRSDYKSMLESILEPSLVISDQFQQHELKMKDGSMVVGRIVADEKESYSLVQSGLEPLKLTKVKKSNVVSKKPSKVSMMPPALIHPMNADELKDLIAYFVSQGNRRHPVRVVR